MSEFFQTPMGRAFYDGTMPRVADELARLNKNLETLIALATAHIEASDGRKAVTFDPIERAHAGERRTQEGQ